MADDVAVIAGSMLEKIFSRFIKYKMLRDNLIESAFIFVALGFISKL